MACRNIVALVESVVAAVSSVTVTLNAVSLLVGQGTQAIATPKDAQGNVLTDARSPRDSSNPLIARERNRRGERACAGNRDNLGDDRRRHRNVAAPGGERGSRGEVTVSLGASSLVVGQTTQATATPRDALGLGARTDGVSLESSSPLWPRKSAGGLVHRRARQERPLPRRSKASRDVACADGERACRECHGTLSPSTISYAAADEQSNRRRAMRVARPPGRRSCGRRRTCWSRRSALWRRDGVSSERRRSRAAPFGCQVCPSVTP
jgi:hypothetical protein